MLNACAASLLSSCSLSFEHANSLIQRLNNRGPVLLSHENQYLAANLLLLRETERSSELKSFVEQRGKPTALEVKREALQSLWLYLYYLDREQYYTAEDIDAVWVVRGPMPMSKAVLAEIHALGPVHKTAAPAVTPIPTPLVIPTLSSYHPPPQKASPAVTRLPAVPLALAKIIDSSKSEPAELSSKGDLLHPVTYSGETLSILARWYTLDRDNAGRIARINKLADPNHLSIGDTITIPRYLLKNRKRLGRKELEELAALAGAESM